MIAVPKQYRKRYSHWFTRSVKVTPAHVSISQPRIKRVPHNKNNEPTICNHTIQTVFAHPVIYPAATPNSAPTKPEARTSTSENQKARRTTNALCVHFSWSF